MITILVLVVFWSVVMIWVIYSCLGSPAKQSLLQELDEFRWIRTSYPEDTTVELTVYENDKGAICRNIFCSADGPNSDGTTFHHTFMGYWNNFVGQEDMEQFARRLIRVIQKRLGITPRLYITAQEREGYAAWCLHDRETPPKGQDVERFLRVEEE